MPLLLPPSEPESSPLGAAENPCVKDPICTTWSSHSKHLGLFHSSPQKLLIASHIKQELCLSKGFICGLSLFRMYVSSLIHVPEFPALVHSTSQWCPHVIFLFSYLGLSHTLSPKHPCPDSGVVLTSLRACRLESRHTNN